MSNIHTRPETGEIGEYPRGTWPSVLLHELTGFGIPPNSSCWYDVGGPDGKVGARALVYLRRRNDVSAGDFRKFISTTLVTGLAGTGTLTELRTQTFMPWYEKLWDTPNVAHDARKHSTSTPH
jgi:hypothetical protein